MSLALSALFKLTHLYPFVRGRDWFFRNFVQNRQLAEQLGQMANPVFTRRGFPIHCNPQDYTSDWIKLWGEHETATEEFLLKNLRAGGGFLDIGANIGYFALLIAHEYGTTVDVIGFEPNPTIFKLFEAGCADSRALRRPRAVQRAVSDEASELDLALDPFNTGHSHLVKGMKEANSVRVGVVRLDDWIATEAPDFRVAALKLDVEGCEMRALRGMEKILRRDRPAIVVEVIEDHLKMFGSNSAEIADFFDRNQYKRLSVPRPDLNWYLISK